MLSRNPEKPYIGVTGVVQVDEAKFVAQAFVKEGLTEIGSNRIGMIGILASQRTLASRGLWTERYPSLAAIRDIFEATHDVAFNTLHYTTYNPRDLSGQLSLLLNYKGLYTDHLCEGVQLNMSWPPLTELKETKDRFPDLKVILQIGPRILSQTSTNEIVARLAAYEKLIQYVLIDPSGGRGMVFEPTSVANLYKQIEESFVNLGLVFAGGFDHKNVKGRLQLLSKAVGSIDFGIDAERGLRINVKGQSATRVSISRATKFVHNSASFFRSSTRKPDTLPG